MGRRSEFSSRGLVSSHLPDNLSKVHCRGLYQGKCKIHRQVRCKVLFSVKCRVLRQAIQTDQVRLPCGTWQTAAPAFQELLEIRNSRNHNLHLSSNTTRRDPCLHSSLQMVSQQPDSHLVRNTQRARRSRIKDDQAPRLWYVGWALLWLVLTRLCGNGRQTIK